MKAYVGLGGNVDDTRAYFASAIEKLKTLGTAEVVSSLYKTEPVGGIAQADFLNAALILETELPPEALLTGIKTIEQEVGRTPSEKNGPREIDIDILLYGDSVIQTAALEIPHPRLAERAFALVPLAEIAPEAVHPLFKKTVRELLAALVDTHGVEKIGTLER